MAKLAEGSTQVHLDLSTGYVYIHASELPLTPLEAHQLAMDLLEVLGPVVKNGQESDAKWLANQSARKNPDDFDVVTAVWP